MAQAHVPDLTTISTLSDAELRFYATIGAVVSLTAAIELMLFDVFVKALGIDRENAGRIYYLSTSGSLQRDMAISAMTERLRGDNLFAEWDTLAKRTVRATGSGGLRNLIAHNIVVRFEMDGSLGGAPLGALPLGGDTEESFHVFQNQWRVVAGKSRPQQAEIGAIHSFANELVELLRSLEEFLAKLP